MSTPVATRVALTGADPASHAVHAVHASGRSYPETNCWADILIELLHARGDEPLAVMGCTLRMDFEGDQWTFFKPAPADLEGLLGVDVHEMQPYRPLPEQIAEQLAAGRTMLVELDSYYLPDTSASSYRREHVKSSVAMEAIDAGSRWLRYFHNAGLHELSGEDFDGVFRLGRPFDADVLPPYTELVRFDEQRRLTGEALRQAAVVAARGHFARRPADNPFTRFGVRLGEDLPGLLAGDEQGYHAYAFATVRMVGAAFEVCASYVRWLLGADGAEAAAAMMRIVEGSKVLSFRLARRRAFDPAERIAELAAAWDEAMAALAPVLATDA